HYLESLARLYGRNLQEADVMWQSKTILGTAVFFVVFSLTAQAQLPATVEIEWLQQFGTFRVAHADIAYSVTSDGSVYIAGQVGGYLPGETSAGGFDSFLRKYDTAGNELWTRQFGTSPSDGNGFDVIHGIAVDDTGVYVAGTA